MPWVRLVNVPATVAGAAADAGAQARSASTADRSEPPLQRGLTSIQASYGVSQRKYPVTNQVTGYSLVC